MEYVIAIFGAIGIVVGFWALHLMGIPLGIITTFFDYRDEHQHFHDD